MVLDARKALRGRESLEVLVDLSERAPLPEPGGRYPMMVRVIGEAVGMLVALVSYIEPKHIYSLFAPWVRRMYAQGFEKEPLEVLWKLVCDFYDKEKARQEEIQKQVQEEEEERRTGIQDLIEKVRTWNSDPEFLADEKEWIRRHAILKYGRQFFLLQPNGGYSLHPIEKDDVIFEFWRKGIAPLLTSLTLDDEPSFRSIFKEFGILIDEVFVDSSLEKSRLRKTKEGWILDLALFRNPVSAEFDKIVDRYLHKLFGEHYSRFQAWLAAAQNFSKPVAALVFSGPPGVGKSMLAAGIAQFLGFENVATQEIFGNWQEALLGTQVVVLEEGFFVNRFSGEKSAFKFKSLIAGDRTSAKVKYMKSVSIRTRARFIITANNPIEVLEPLVRGMEANEDAIKSVAERLYPVTGLKEAKWFLDEYGNYELTQDWLNSEKKILAKHLKWLADHYKGDLNGRFQLPASDKIFIEFREEFLEETIESLADPFQEQIVILAIQFVNFAFQKAPNLLKEGRFFRQIDLRNYIQRSGERLQLPTMTKLGRLLRRFCIQKKFHGFHFWAIDTQKVKSFAAELGVELLWEK
jgi:DNA polymerase III delta prime subunit